MIISWPDAPRNEPTHSTTSSRAGLISIPEAVLDRHGASVLRPAEAALLPDQPPVRPTVYRTFVLLIQNILLADKHVIGMINDALEGIGLVIDDGPGFDDDLPNSVPRPVGLKPLGDPVVVDAWHALQTLRAAARTERYAALPIDGISLDHLLFGSAATGTGLGVVEGVPGMGNGNATGPGGDSTNYGYWPHPVALAMDLPARAEECPPGERRVVVAVLDTGIDYNEPLGVTVAKQDEKEQLVVGDSIQFDQVIQDAVLDSGERLQSMFPERNIEVINGVRDVPFTTQPLIGELATHSGHGTFITGIIRQAAPDADVLEVRTLHSDGIGYQADALAALGALLKRVEKAQVTSDATKMVDVVSISWGCFNESPDQHLPGIAEVIEELRCRGVVVVAAAGNYATDRPFYPAALSTHPGHQCETDPPPEPVISVSALNPNGSRAIYGNAGEWVTCWATGTAVISTFPQRINASRNPSLRVRTTNGKNLPQTRESLDGDDHAGGFREWTGTSFAAPFVAASIAVELRWQGGLCEISCATARERARQAVQAVRVKGAEVRLPVNSQ